MMMDAHSKNVCLIAILNFLFCSAVAVRPLKLAVYFYPHPVFRYELATGGFFVLMAATALLMIRGVVAKQRYLIAPFLGINIALLIYEMFEFARRFALHSGSPFYVDETVSYRIGFVSISVYTIYTFYCKLRSQHSKEEPTTALSEEKK